MLTSMGVFLLAGISRRHAASALAWTGALTAAIVVPLGLSFQTLVREAAEHLVCLNGYEDPGAKGRAHGVGLSLSRLATYIES